MSREKIRATTSFIEIDCQVDGMKGVLRIERTRRGRLRVLIADGFADPVAVLGKRKTKALVNWLAATQGVEPEA